MGVSVAPLFISAALFFLSPDCRAQNPLFEMYPGSKPVANTLIRSGTMESVVRGMIARLLNAGSIGSTLQVETPPFEENIPIPETTGSLKEILEVLGLRGSLNLKIDPVKATLNLPADRLKVVVVKTAKETFQIDASWQVETLDAIAPRVSIQAPAGVFDRPLRIDSNRSGIGLTRNSPPIHVQLKMVLELSDFGTRFHLISAKTNLTSTKGRPEFDLKLGKLTVDGDPLRIEIDSNGTKLVAEEARIRKEFEQIEPAIMNGLRAEMVKNIEAAIRTVTNQLDAAPPVKIDLNSTELLQNAGLGQGYQDLLSDIKMEFLFTYLQAVKESDLFSAQIGARFFINGECLSGPNPSSPINTQDIALMAPEDHVGMVIYESLLQDVLHSTPFQARIRKLYESSGPSPGVAISPAGVRVRFLPAENAVSAILNLQIDIARTIKTNSSFGDRLKLTIGDWIEQEFGSGSSVKIPIEIKFKIEGVGTAPDGRKSLELGVVMPFTASGTYLPPRNCPKGWCESNVNSMTSVVKSGFIESVRKEVEGLLPQKLTLPLGEKISVRDFTFTAGHVKVTPNHGLLLTGKLRDEGGRKP